MEPTLWTSRSIRNLVSVVLAVAALFLFVETVFVMKSWDSAGNKIQPDIVVSGTGEAFAIPDIATFTYTINESGKSVKEAQDKSSKKGNEALAYLEKAGVDKKDVQTVAYNANPKYEYEQGVCTNLRCPPGKQVLIGYEVSQSVRVKVRDTEKGGSILSGIGGLIQNVSGLEFTVDDDDAVMAEARDKAVADAKSKAETLARSLGVRLVKVRGFYENNSGGRYFGMGGMEKMDLAVSASSVAPQLSPGENKYISNVSITYEIK